jgi:hypothetical protein
MNILQIQNRVQELPNTPQTMQYLNAALNGQVTTVPPYIAAAELKRRETEGMMDQLAKGAAKGPQPTVKDQLEEKMGIMALMGQAQPPQRPQIPQPAGPEQQPQAEGGIDSLPVKDEMFGMAGGGIVAFSGGGQGVVTTASKAPISVQELSRLYRIDPQLAKDAALRAGPAGQRMLAQVAQLAGSAAGPAAALSLVPAGMAYGLKSAMDDMRAQGYPVDPMGEFGTGAATPEQAEFDEARRQRLLQGEAQRRSEDARLNAAVEGRSAPAKDRLSPEDMALRRQPAPTPTSDRPPGARPPAAAKPPAAPTTPTAPGISLADQDPGRNLMDALGADPAYQKMLASMNAANPYAGKQETQQEYIDRMRKGILSQIPGGKMPWETSEGRLKEIEDRRRREDADYEAMTKGEGRRLDNLMTLISNMGAGSFGQAGSRGVRALQKVEREQAAETTRRKEARDAQALKLMEIRALNDQAEFAAASGNVKEYERLTQEAMKLKTEYDLKQADMAKGIMESGASARKGDVEDKRAREKLIEESRQKGLDRESSEKIARIQSAARQAGRGELTPAQAAKIMKDAEAAIVAREKNDSRLRSEYRNNPAARAAAVEAEANRMLGGYTSGSPSSKPDGGAPEGWGKPTVVKP